MSGPAPIVLDGVWKRFRRGQRHDNLREWIPAATRALLGRARKGAESREFWALRDVSLTVEPGEILGIIGPNGAGKSTILKLLTGILRPTRGKVRVEGRVGALIELAAGFHPDLTGRENIYLQGAFLGMRRREVAEKFDRIVEFAGVEEFIDTPVKRYSSGMHARLGFAIAGHLDPDALLVDEVLSVGDHEFQRRASERLLEIARRGIPVIAVSHQLERISEMCDRAVLLSGGETVLTGPASACVAAYVDGLHLEARPEGAGAPIRLDELRATSSGPIRSGDPLELVLRGTITDAAAAAEAMVGIRVRRLPAEERLFATTHPACGIELPAEGEFALGIGLRMNAGPGVYRLQAAVWRRADDSEWAHGPSVIITVERAPASYGRLHLEPTMRRLEP